jgi:cobalt-zinc-cadmium efflux system outer membrane protein
MNGRHSRWCNQITLVALFAVLFGGPSLAQQSRSPTTDQSRFIDPGRGLSVDQLVALAIDTSPSILAARARVEVARGLRVQADLRSNPSLMVDWREQTAGTDRQTMVGLSIPLDLFRRPGRLAVADSDIAIAEREVVELEREVAGVVRAKAVAVLGALRQLQVRERVADTLSQFRDLLHAKAQSGVTPPLERDVAEVEARRSEAEVLRQRAAVNSALAGLRGALGVQLDQAPTLREDLDQLRVSRQLAVQPGLTRPDIQVAQERLRRATAAVDLIRREAKPDLDLTASYMRMKSGFPLSGVDAAGVARPIEGVFHNLSLGATVTLPWRDRRQGDLAAATARVREAEHTLEAKKRLAAAEVQAAEARLQHFEDALVIYERGLRDLAAKNVDVVRQSYELGRATLLDVLNETRRLLDTEMAYTDLLIEALQARYDLASAIGTIR